MLDSESQSYKWYATLILAAGALWIWVSAAPPTETTGGLIPAPQAGFLAPDFTLQTTTGEEITLSDLRGQAVILNLWASWCIPCRKEMPAMQRAYDQFEEGEATILAVNAANQDREENALAFINAYNITFPILLDVNGEVSRMYNLRALPSTFFIDVNGIIQEVVVGGPMAEALLLTRVEKLTGGGR